jgi:hypothetical protein
MRFSLGNWHPLLSHGACLVIGLLINSGTAEIKPRDDQQFKAGRSYLALGKSLVESIDGAPSLTAGTPVALTRTLRSTAKFRCRYSPDFSLLLQIEPFPLVELPSSEVQHWAEYLGAKDKKPFLLVALAQSASLPLCSTLPKVSYGSLF